MIGALHRSKRPGSPRAVQFSEELRRPLVVIIPHLLEQLWSEARPRLHLLRTRRQHHAIFRERGTLKIAIFGDDGLMTKQRPQPRNIDAVGGQIVHEALLEFVVVDGGGEVAVQDLEAVIRRHVERMLNVLDGDVAFGHAIDGVPQLLAEQLLRRVQRFLANDGGVILPCAFSKPRDSSSARSDSARPLATVGTALPLASTVSRGASSIACNSAKRRRSGPFPAATYAGSGLATQLWRYAS